MNPAAPHLLLGPASIDRYVDEGPELPGGGALNMAVHLAALDVPFVLVSRVGTDGREMFERFVARHGITVPESFVVPGRSASIDIVIRSDRQPWMDGFVEGVWDGFRLTRAEETLVAQARSLHAVMVDAVTTEIERLAVAGTLHDLSVSADFLDFRHVPIDRFDGLMHHVGLAFIGWPGDADHPTVGAIRDVVLRRHKLAVVTLGARGMLVIDGRTEASVRQMPIEAVPVEGTTLGCGDAFIAAFLAEWWGGAHLDTALGAGARAGAAATAWLRPLPDAAYG